MEFYESTCTQCRHRWTWTGYKTGLGKTPAQLEQMSKAGKTCPRCGGPATVDLDMTSETAQAMNQMLVGLILPRLKDKLDAIPDPPPASSDIPAGFHRQDPVMEVYHSALAPTEGGAMYRRLCVRCGQGVLLVQRDPMTFEIRAEDNCVRCGQRYRYLDIEQLRKGPVA